MRSVVSTQKSYRSGNGYFGDVN